MNTRVTTTDIKYKNKAILKTTINAYNKLHKALATIDYIVSKLYVIAVVYNPLDAKKDIEKYVSEQDLLYVGDILNGGCNG